MNCSIGVYAVSIIILCFLAIIGPDGFNAFIKRIKKINLRDLKNIHKYIFRIFKRIPKPFNYAYAGLAILVIFCIVINAIDVSTTGSNELDLRTIISAIGLIITTIAILYFVLGLFAFIAFNVIEYLFKFLDAYMFRISNIAFISMVFSTVLLVVCLQNYEPIIIKLLFLAAVCIHITALYGLVLIIKSVNPFKGNEYYTSHNILIGLLVWLIILLTPIYTEVILCTKFIDSAFILGNTEIIGYGDLLYFTVVTFASIGFGDILPNHPLSQGVTVGIIISSIIYMILFIGSAISGLTGRTVDPTVGKTGGEGK